jgi:hypothetical protein
MDAHRWFANLSECQTVSRQSKQGMKKIIDFTIPQLAQRANSIGYLQKATPR